MSAKAWAGAVVALAAGLSGCGHATRTGTPHATPAPAPAAAAAAARPEPLLYVWRNFEETGIPDEVTIYGDGAVRYRNLLHTQTSIAEQRARLRPRELGQVRALLRGIDLRREDASSVRPTRTGFRYVLRSGGRAGTAADGHLHGRVRRLVVRVGALMDRLKRRSL